MAGLLTPNEPTMIVSLGVVISGSVASVKLTILDMMNVAAG